MSSQIRTAYEQGAEAKERGYERRSPYINIKAERYWCAGFDGIPYEEVA